MNFRDVGKTVARKQDNVVEENMTEKHQNRALLHRVLHRHMAKELLPEDFLVRQQKNDHLSVTAEDTKRSSRGLLVTTEKV